MKQKGSFIANEIMQDLEREKQWKRTAERLNDFKKNKKKEIKNGDKYIRN